MEKNKQQSIETEKIQQDTNYEEKINKNLVLVESALYVAGRPLDLRELCSVLSTRSKTKTKKYVKLLMQQYSDRNTSLEIIELKDGKINRMGSFNEIVGN